MDLLALAKTIADRVEAAASRAVVPVSVCIIDTHGNVILTHRMSGAPAFSLEISERKAYTSALVGMRTADLLPLVQPGQDLFPLMTVAGGRYCAMRLSRGGAPEPFDKERSDIPTLRAVMEAHDSAWQSLVAGDLDSTSVVVEYEDSGYETHAPLGIRLAQALHHGTDHRSQVCTALTTLGIEPPAIENSDAMPR